MIAQHIKQIARVVSSIITSSKISFPSDFTVAYNFTQDSFSKATFRLLDAVLLKEELTELLKIANSNDVSLHIKPLIDSKGLELTLTAYEDASSE